MEEAIDLLIKTERIPEAAMLARAYAPEQISRVIGLWKSSLINKNRKKTAESLADPAQYPNLFPELTEKEPESLLDIEDKQEGESSPTAADEE